MTLGLRVSLTCNVCRQQIDPQRQRDTVITVALFGVKRYAVCICCQQEAPAPNDPGYRRRWRDYEMATK